MFGTLVCVTSLTSISQWEFTAPSQSYPYVSEDFSSVMQEINRIKLDGLNVDLPTYFETMNYLKMAFKIE